MKPKPKVKNVFSKKTRAPKKGYQYIEMTSGKIPDPAVEPIKTKRAKLKPMRTVSSGTNSYGKPTKSVDNKTRRSL